MRSTQNAGAAFWVIKIDARQSGLRAHHGQNLPPRLSTSLHALTSATLPQPLGQMQFMLPFHIRTDVFWAAVAVDPSIFAWGGDLVKWDSNETVAPLALVGPAEWFDASIFVLNSSVALSSGAQARSFLRTLREHPERALYVRQLSVGLRSADADQPDAAAESTALVEVLEACPRVAHLQLRTLHTSMRARARAVIASMELKSLVVRTPRKTTNHGLFFSTDLAELVSPSLKTLEIDFWSHRAEITTPTPTPPPPFGPLTLRDVRIEVSGDDDDTCVLPFVAAAGPNLETLDLYLENIIDPDAMFDALSPSVSSLRTLSVTENPSDQILDQITTSGSTPALDRLLPHFQHLETLTASATEVSYQVLHLVPPSLRRLQVASYTPDPAFRFHETLVADLRNPALKIGITSLEVYDETWEEAEAEELKAACASRGLMCTLDID